MHQQSTTIIKYKQLTLCNRAKSVAKHLHLWLKNIGIALCLTNNQKYDHSYFTTSLAWWLSNHTVLWNHSSLCRIKPKAHKYHWNDFPLSSSHNCTLFLEITHSTWSVFCLQTNIGEKLSLEIFSIKFSWLLYGTTMVPLNLRPK